jgi:hypothetical protein
VGSSFVMFAPFVRFLVWSKGDVELADWLPL